MEQNEFMDLTDAARGTGRWVEHYNHRRTHHGLGGLLVPADRFYGVADQTLKKIEQGLGADTAELTSPDSRGIYLSQGCNSLRLQTTDMVDGGENYRVRG